jgi:peptide deformylase
MNEDQPKNETSEVVEATTTEEVQKYRLRTILSDEDTMLLRSRSDDVALVFADNSGNAYPGPETRELIKALKDFIIENNALGMAAIQLGVSERVFVMRRPWSSDQLMTVINPVVKRREGGSKKAEGCFSVPVPDNMQARILRASRIWVSFTDENGVEHDNELLIGMDARVFQHELDHLNGSLMIDEKLSTGGKFLGWSRS